jgi:hypothetical protein
VRGTYAIKGLAQTGLLQNAVRSVPRFYLRIDGKAPLGLGAEPDLVIAFALPFPAAACVPQQPPQARRAVGHQAA